MKKRTKIILLIIPVPLGLSLLGSYLALLYVPDWYKPEHISSHKQQELRDEFTELTRVFNNKMQKPEEFEFEITRTQANRILAGRKYLDESLGRLVPEKLKNPAVSWEKNCIRGGALVEYKGCRTLATVTAQIKVTDDYIEIEDIDASVGLWPVPDGIIEKHIKESLPEYTSNLSIPNHLECPNSYYDIQIKKIDTRGEKLILTIQPVASVE